MGRSRIDLGNVPIKAQVMSKNKVKSREDAFDGLPNVPVKFTEEDIVRKNNFYQNMILETVQVLRTYRTCEEYLERLQEHPGVVYAAREIMNRIDTGAKDLVDSQQEQE